MFASVAISTTWQSHGSTPGWADRTSLGLRPSAPVQNSFHRHRGRLLRVEDRSSGRVSRPMRHSQPQGKSDGEIWYLTSPELWGKGNRHKGREKTARAWILRDEPAPN